MHDDANIEEEPVSEGAPKPSTASPLNRAQLTFVAVAALLCVALIGGSIWSLVTGGGLAPGEGQSVATAGSDDGRLDRPTGADDAASAGDADPEGSMSAEGSSTSGQESGDASRGSSDGSGDSSASKGQSQETAGGSPSSGSSGSGPSSGNSGATGGQGSSQPAPKSVTVTISADGSVGGGAAAGPVTLTFEEGATVYDALAGSGWSVLADWGAFGAYVTSINGVAAGPNTGWTYTVNGSQPNYACSSYTLSDGDAIHWTFVEVK